jgi:hypothetical protein
LPLQGTGVRGGESNLLPSQVFSEQAGLLAAEIGERIVIVPQAGLAVPDQI